MNRIFLTLWLGVFATAVLADPNKHFLETPDVDLYNAENFGSKGFAWSEPIAYSPRVRRQLMTGPSNFFIYDTDTPDESGPWDEWQAGDPTCSRTCGGGVHIETRTCPQGSDCVGPSKRYSSCNIEPCPGGSRLFREEQCSKFDNDLFEGRYHTWVPYLRAPRKCELNCMPRGERFYYRFSKKVVDGTSCDMKDGLPRSCVEGECRQIGCDGMLGSLATEDKCRVCGGDGQDCDTVTGVLENQDLVMGYNDLLLIPAGATNIKITEAKASYNYIALRNMSGHYFINGNWRIDFADDYEVAGTIFRYERKIKPGAKKGRAKLLSMFAPEELSALGPTNEPLYVVILSQEENPGIEFEYSLRSGTIKETPVGGETYDWQVGTWNDCSAPCGGGTKTRQILCQSSSSKEIMPPHLCDTFRKPVDNDTCNEDPCEPKWQTGEWSNCTAMPMGGDGSGDGSGDGGSEDVAVASGNGECPGYMFRNVLCEQIASTSGLASVVEENLCKEDEKPIAYKTCDDVVDTGDDSGPKFFVGPWSGCTALCGDGVRTRTITCYKKNSEGKIEVLEDAECSASPKPADEEQCKADKNCGPADWIITDWTSCEGQCGLFMKSRSAICSDSEGAPIENGTLCDPANVPKLTEDCNAPEEGSGDGSGEGSGDGSGDGSGEGSAEGSGSGDDQKKTENLSEFVCEFSWFATQWSVCSSACTGLKGVQTRKVFCASVGENNSIKIEEDSACEESKKYEIEQDCEGSETCDKGHWFTSLWGPCSKSCDGGMKNRKVFCLKDGASAEPDQCDGDKMPLSEESCNKDSCPEASGEGEEAEKEGEPKCAAYYDDFWIFGEGSGGSSSPEDDQMMVDKVSDPGSDGSGSGEGSGDGGLSQEELMAMFSRRCKPEAVSPCQNSTFGCCDNEFDSAKGPFDEGCEPIKTCEDTKYGCCQDGATQANGTAFQGCPDTNCEATLFGCCTDGETAASGPDGENCDENRSCKSGKFGCCPDKVTFAQGPHKQGCFQCPPEIWRCDSCEKTEFGCCIDLENAATGPNFEGCPDEDGSGAGYVDCTVTEHGCCPDGEAKAKGPDFKGCKIATPCKDSQFGCCEDLIHPAHGLKQEGCCLNTKFGCCPDNIMAAKGPNHEGCSCEATEFGCCPDDVTAAEGKDFKGCGCVASEHGCCPDNFTPAQGPHFLNCSCHTYEYGCCPDGKSIARGPGQEGCSCKDTEFGCCPDRQTPAQGPKGFGCGCAASKFGCCPDGVTDAEQEDFAGCDSDVMPVVATPDVCGLPKERGPSRNFTTRWFFDMEYGGCTKFWYGGDGGNGNNFLEKSSCTEVCVDPIGKDACQLPVVPGPCEGYYPRFGYDRETKTCNQFVYGGCLGNNNRFESIQECEAVCTEGGDSSIDYILVDKCKQPIKSGPCQGNFTRWGYNQDNEKCEEFNYGGCKGNLNSFLTNEECINSCENRGTTARDMCLLPRSQGPCKDNLPKWYFDNSEKRCMPFYYGGCEGNDNRFDSLESCQKSCPAAFLQADVCQQPKEEGPCRDFLERYYFDPSDGTCHNFYYGGCEGNKNNFKSLDSCKSRCSVDFSIPITEEFKLEFCFMSKSDGSSEGYEGEPQKRWHYDTSDGTCKSFNYLGKKGNGNRFLTRQECHTSCQPSQDFCQLPKVVGPCKDKVERWWYDKSKDSCFTFDWGGCHGNLNKFETEDFCKSACQRSGPGVINRPKPPGPQGSLVKVCNLPKDSGTGDAKTPNWYYDSEKGECTAFIYHGAEGNANRFETQEQCDRECGIFRDQDVCSMDMEIGPCVGRFRKWAYDRRRKVCKEFTFGGCEGNGNRFSSLDECETVCFMREEPKISGTNTSLSHAAICELDSDAGPCEGGDLKRWYFNNLRQTCVPFIYSGCAGNRNRFKSFDACMGFCAPEKLESIPKDPDSTADQQSPGPGRHPEAPPMVDHYPEEPPPEPEIPSTMPEYDTATEQDPNRCQAADTRCSKLECPYGKLRYRDDRSQCIECYCNEPCYGFECHNGQTCHVDLVKDRASQIHYKAVCREPNKEGICPKLSRENQYAECSDDCQTDAECSGEQKCCFNGCGKSCMDPVGDPGEQLPSELDENGKSTEPVDPNAPQIRVHQPSVTVTEGGLAVLSVYVSGNPVPDVYWRKGKNDITNVGKYRIIEGGGLQIVGADISDEGSYTCIADNGRGIPPQAQVTLKVSNPSRIPATMVDTSDDELVMSLGAPAHIRCLVYGYPKPEVTWWRGSSMLTLPTDNMYQPGEGSSLLVRNLGLRDLGPYTCQAYNGLGPAVSSGTVLKALGPVSPTGNREDDANLAYVISAPRAPGSAPPDYRPTVPPSWQEPELTTTEPYYPYERPVTQAPTLPPTTTVARPELGYLEVRIDLQRSRFPLNEQITIPCTVNSYVRPSIEWTKNGYRLNPDQRIQIVNDRLIINNSRTSDSGTYTCEASNGYRSQSASIPIAIEDISVSSECTDNPYFANCKLIVKAEYCTNKYYAKFCCLSCTLSGQLRGF